jgi:hypothetical protein
MRPDTAAKEIVMSERSITAGGEFRADQLLESSAVERQEWKPEMLGAVPIPPEDARCTAISLRSGNRCKRYRQANSSVCSKHASVERAARSVLDINRSGSGKPTAEHDTDTWPWTEDQWQARFDAVNDWVHNQLPVTNPALSERLWQFVAQAETELQPEQIFELAGWFGNVVQGAAVVAAEEGLTLTG